jgi:hypothetical protein
MNYNIFFSLSICKRYIYLTPYYFAAFVAKTPITCIYIYLLSIAIDNNNNNNHYNIYVYYVQSFNITLYMNSICIV